MIETQVRGQAEDWPDENLGECPACGWAARPTPDQPPGSGRASRAGRPRRLVRSVLASRACSEDFGPMMHQAAWERNFFAPGRRVFSWRTVCRRWIQAVWSGGVATLLPELEARAAAFCAG